MDILGANQTLRRYFNHVAGLFSNDMGIDLGTASTLIYVKDQGIVLCEPSVVAIQKGTSYVRAVGLEAKRMLGKTPGSIVATRPLRDGVIADFDVTECMLRYFIKKVQPKRTLVKRPRIIIAVPSGITEVEKRAVQDSAYRAGAREVHLLEEPIAAAIGIGLPIEEPRGNMVIDIGGGTTEIAITSLGGIVCAHSIRIGGDVFDRSIIEYIDRYYNLLIGEPTAEEIKIKIGSASPLDEELEMEVTGKDKTIGLPKVIKVTSEEIRQALDGPIKEIIKATKITLDNAPPEIAADLIERGIVMCGGGSLLRNFNSLIAEQTGLPVVVADDPLTSVVLGTGKALEEIKYLRESKLMRKNRLA